MTTRPLSGRAPRLKTPPGTCDTHIHFYDKRALALPGTPSPTDASAGEYRQLMNWLGIERVVAVQPNAYGDDNTLLMESVAQLGPCARAVAVVKPGVSDDELDRLTKGGARAFRCMALHGGTLGPDRLEEMAARVQPFGWSAIVQLDGRELPDYEAMLSGLPGKFVIDHIGKFLDPVSPDHAAFKSLLRIVDTGRCWVKLAGPYEHPGPGRRIMTMSDSSPGRWCAPRRIA